MGLGGAKKEQHTSTNTAPSFVLGMNGQGIGEVEDALIAVNADNRYIL